MHDHQHQPEKASPSSPDLPTVVRASWETMLLLALRRITGTGASLPAQSRQSAHLCSGHVT